MEVKDHLEYPRLEQITQRFNYLLGSITITHPLHPLCGQCYEILKVKEVNGTRRYSLNTDSGVMCVPESWTDRQVQKKSNKDSQGVPFDAYILKELVQFLQSLDNFTNEKGN